MPIPRARFPSTRSPKIGPFGLASRLRGKGCGGMKRFTFSFSRRRLTHQTGRARTRRPPGISSHCGHVLRLARKGGQWRHHYSKPKIVQLIVMGRLAFSSWAHATESNAGGTPAQDPGRLPTTDRDRGFSQTQITAVEFHWAQTAKRNASLFSSTSSDWPRAQFQREPAPVSR